MKKNKGITLVPLIVLIIIMLILLGISVEISRNILEKSKAEKLFTYMKLIELRANAYYEEINFKIGAKDFESYIRINEAENFINPDEELKKIERKIMDDGNTNMENWCIFIKWDKSKLVEQGIDENFLIKDDEYFIVAYNYEEGWVEEVYYNKGIYLNGNKTLIYSVSELEREIGK